jgi:hypothetical protein
MGPVLDDNAPGQRGSRSNMNVFTDVSVMVDCGASIDDAVRPDVTAGLDYRTGHDLDSFA